jgi:hypothetical protein
MIKKSVQIIVLNKDNISDFSKERNKLLGNSKADWVFFLDSDEKMSPGLRKEILRKIRDDKFNGFIVNRKNYFLGKFVGTDKILRLGKKGKGKWYRKVHEVWQIKGNIGKLENPIIHNSYKSLYEAIRKVNYYSTLHAEANLDEAKKSNLLKIIFYPPVKFIQSFLMGRGFVFSMLQSFHSFLGWAKLWQLQQKN